MASERWPNGGSRAWRKLRAQVLERDGGRCTFVAGAEDGHTAGGPVQGRLVPGARIVDGRCEATARLEAHHLRPGPAIEADLEDLITVCRTHHPPPDAAWREDTQEAAAAARAAIAKLDVQEIDIRQLMPAVWNANTVPRETLERIKNSIREYGVVENLVVRPHPEFDGKYEVLSGNHRLKIFKQLRLKTAACHVVRLDDAMARLLAQTLNRTRGVDDPTKLAALMEEIHEALPKQKVDEFLADMTKLPRGGLDGKSMQRLLAHQKEGEGVGYQFRPIHPLKLGQRLEACVHLPRTRKALELFSGRGQLTYWYGRVFEQVVRVDADAEGKPDHHMPATEYLRTRFLDDAPFDLVDFDDEGSPHEELDAFFALIREHPQPPFVLCVTDGLAHRLKLIRKVPTDLMKVYRWPDKGADKRLYLRCPELLDHGVRARAEEAGYSAELITVEWKPGKSATFGSWLIGPEQDTRLPIERDLEGEDTTPEAWGAWRVTPKPREMKPPVEPLDKKRKKKEE